MEARTSDRGWAVAELSAIPSLWNVGHDGQVLDEDDAYERVAANDPGIIERWDGIAAWTAPAGQCVVPPHSESAAGYHQEELCIVLAGSAKVVCDGDEMVLKSGQLLYVSPDVFREGVALETPTTVMVVGGRPGRAYTPAPFALDGLGED